MCDVTKLLLAVLLLLLFDLLAEEEEDLGALLDVAVDLVVPVTRGVVKQVLHLLSEHLDPPLILLLVDLGRWFAPHVPSKACKKHLIISRT